MFVLIDDTLFKLSEINYIKRIGCGIRLYCKFGNVDIATVSDEKWEELKSKLTNTNVIITTPVNVPDKQNAYDTDNIRYMDL